MDDNNIIKAIERQKHFRDSFFENKKIYKRTQISERDKNVFVNNSLIKIVAGPRRSGKSTFLFSLLKGEDFIYVNFDDLRMVESIDDFNLFLDLLEEVYGPTKNVLFDEIQNLEK